MRIVVLGATGGTGRLVIEQAVARGHEIVAYVRRPEVLATSTGLTVVQGELSNIKALQAALDGADAVLCCLGTHEKRNVDLMQKSLPLIIRAMQGARVFRLVLMSAYGVGDTAHSASFIARFAYKTLVASVYQDKERSEAMLLNTNIKWTVLYPVILTDGPLLDDAEVRPVTNVRKVSGLPKISRANVARVMLDAAEDDQTIGQRILISSRGSVR
jgi:uncharacterized protein YbjT (DUF2867 family)